MIFQTSQPRYKEDRGLHYEDILGSICAYIYQ